MSIPAASGSSTGKLTALLFCWHHLSLTPHGASARAVQRKVVSQTRSATLTQTKLNTGPRTTLQVGLTNAPVSSRSWLPTPRGTSSVIRPEHHRCSLRYCPDPSVWRPTAGEQLVEGYPVEDSSRRDRSVRTSRWTDGAGLEADQREAAIDPVLRATHLGLSDLPMP